MPDTPIQTDQTPVVPHQRARLWIPIAAHSVTDFLSFVPIALMPLLAFRLGMDNDQRALLLSTGAFVSGGIQPLVAWINDKFDTRSTGTIGLVLAALAIGGLGYTDTFLQLLVLFTIGVAGVGAFHPAAASIVGQLAGKRRSTMLSVFFLFGMIGGISGNVLSPYYVNFMGSIPAVEQTIDGLTFDDPATAQQAAQATGTGLRALAWFIPPALLSAAVLWWAISKAPHRHNGAKDLHNSLTSDERRLRLRAFWILYAGNAIRFITNQMLFYLVIEWSIRLVKRHAEAETLTEALGQQASEINGPLLGAMQVGMGFGALSLGVFLRAKYEKTAFIIIPLIGSVAIACTPLADAFMERGVLTTAAIAGVLTIIAGFGFGSLVPVALSLGQRLLPHRTAFASGMLLGGAWCTAIVGPLIVREIHKGIDENLEAGFYVTAATLLIASLLAIALPGRLIRSIAPH